MRFNLKKIASIILVATIGVVSLIAASASTVTLRLSPAAGSFVKGTTFTSDIILDTDTLINYVRADIFFSGSLIEVVSISTQSSSFDSGPTPFYYNQYGFIRVERNDTSWVQGNGLIVATITFRAKAAGNASASFVSSSEASYPSNGTNKLTTKKGASYTITESPPPPPPTTPPPTTPPPTTPPPSTPPPTTPPPTTPPPSTPPPESDIPVVENIPLNDPTPPESYEVQVVMRYYSPNGNPITGAEVKIDEHELQTDDQGTINVLLPPGEYNVHFNINGNSDTFGFKVYGDSEVQNFQFESSIPLSSPVTRKQSSPTLKTILFVIGIMLLIALLSFVSAKAIKRLLVSRLRNSGLAEERFIRLGHGIVETIIYGSKHPAAIKRIHEQIELQKKAEVEVAKSKSSHASNIKSRRHKTELTEHPEERSSISEESTANIKEEPSPDYVNYPGHAVSLDEPEPEDMFEQAEHERQDN